MLNDGSFYRRIIALRNNVAADCQGSGSRDEARSRHQDRVQSAAWLTWRSEYGWNRLIALSSAYRARRSQIEKFTSALFPNWSSRTLTFDLHQIAFTPRQCLPQVDIAVFRWELSTMKISSRLLAGAGLLALSCVSAFAQQFTGTPGSPAATTTIDWKALRHPIRSSAA